MNKILLIGNGFDLAHKLKTRYNDFINYFWENEAELLIKEHNKITNDPANIETRPTIFEYKDDFISISNVRYSPKKIQLTSSNEKGFHYFKYILSFLGGNIQQNYKIQNLFLERITNKSFEDWVDIEYEYYNSLLECVNGNMKYGIKKLNAEFSNITKALEKYLSIQMEKETVLSDKIKEHIISIIKPVDVKGYYASNLDDNILILNFNYTDVIERYINNYFQFCKNNVKCLYIHGQLNNSSNTIIFGYGDELDNNYKLIENAIDNNYLDNVKSIRYSKTKNYKEMLDFIEPAGYEIYIMGHSCGISDKTLLNTLFEHKNCLSINIFYHKINDTTDNYIDIYKNISRIFTDKQKMRKIVLNQPDCLPLIS